MQYFVLDEQDAPHEAKPDTDSAAVFGSTAYLTSFSHLASSTPVNHGDPPSKSSASVAAADIDSLFFSTARSRDCRFPFSV